MCEKSILIFLAAKKVWKCLQPTVSKILKPTLEKMIDKFEKSMLEKLDKAFADNAVIDKKTKKMLAESTQDMIDFAKNEIKNGKAKEIKELENVINEHIQRSIMAISNNQEVLFLLDSEESDELSGTISVLRKHSTFHFQKLEKHLTDKYAINSNIDDQISSQKNLILQNQKLKFVTTNKEANLSQDKDVLLNNSLNLHHLDTLQNIKSSSHNYTALNPYIETKYSKHFVSWENLAAHGKESAKILGHLDNESEL